MLQEIKILIRDQLGLPLWLVLVLLGLAAHIAVNLLIRKPLTSGWGLLGALALGVAIETYEIWVEYRRIGLFADGNDPVAVILARHLGDVAKTLAAPVLLVTLGALTSR